MIERDAYLALSSFTPFGPVHVTHLLSYFGSAAKVWKASERELDEVGLKQKTREAFIIHRGHFDLEHYKQQLAKHSIQWITKVESLYPQQLQGLKDAPHTLYYKGEFSARDRDAVAIVGSRSMSQYGRTACQKLSYDLASMGVTIVSGLALGIDGIAHKAALEAGGRCIAVLASGLDTISPLTNKWIADRIVENTNGVVVSEYPLSTPPAKSHFPSRNRIISGLSRGVIVVEGRIKSGTLHTVKHAADQGRSVFAVPGEITSPLSEVCHYLIRNGAALITKAEDVLEDLNLQLQTDREEMHKLMPTDEIEKQILTLLQVRNLTIDEIVRASQRDISIVTTKVTMMELKGLVRQVEEGKYYKA